MIETLNASQARELANKNREEFDRSQEKDLADEIDTRIVRHSGIGCFDFFIDVSGKLDHTIKNVMNYFIGKGYSVNKKTLRGGDWDGLVVLTISWGPTTTSVSRVGGFFKKFFAMKKIIILSVIAVILMGLSSILVLEGKNHLGLILSCFSGVSIGFILQDNK